MRVKTTDLIEGCTLSEDVYSQTSRPIVKKNTVLTKELIEILKSFLITNVEISHILVTGETFTPSEILVDIKNVPSGASRVNEKREFTTLFLEATQKYKAHFQSWQSGLPIDISKVRTIILPLLEETQNKSSQIFYLHHFSTKEEYLYQHALVVGLLCGYIAKQQKFTQGNIVQAALAGLLADCGMVKLQPSIIQKKTALTPNEFKEIKNHTNYSYQMVQHIPSLKEGVKVAIFQHHERLDGSGYPMRLTNNKIHSVAQVIAVADTYHAMTSERMYRKKQSPFRVLELMKQDQFGQFDLSALNALCSWIVNFSKGSQIKLSNGQLGEVLFITDKSPTRPLIKINNTGEIINLEEFRELYVEEII
jgi:HD-GYP domain-containing protein (c-di-GMP phosphodiesterase class II)